MIIIVRDFKMLIYIFNQPENIKPSDITAIGNLETADGRLGIGIDVRHWNSTTLEFEIVHVVVDINELLTMFLAEIQNINQILDKFQNSMIKVDNLLKSIKNI